MLLAAGPSARFGGPVSKVLRPLAGKPVIVRALAPFLVAVRSLALVVVTRKEDQRAVQRLLPHARQVEGGATRVESLERGLAQLPDTIEVVLVHDASRPLATADLVRRVLATARRDGAAAPVAPVRDAVHPVSPADDAHPSRLEGSLDRSRLGLAQSPQAARLDLLRRALARRREPGLFGPSPDLDDEAELLLQAGIPVTAVRGEITNLRIAEPDDLRLAEGLFQQE